MGIRFAPNRMSILCTTLHFSPRSSLYYTLFNPARKTSLPKVKRYISGWRIWTVTSLLLGYPFGYTKIWYCNMIWCIKGGIESSTRARELMGALVLIPFRLQIINVGWVGGLKSRSCSWSAVVRLLVARSRLGSRPGSGCFCCPSFGRLIVF